MATSDKVQKLSGEAFYKLKSDHEQFLEAYESKSTPLYMCRVDSLTESVMRPLPYPPFQILNECLFAIRQLYLSKHNVFESLLYGNTASV